MEVLSDKELHVRAPEGVSMWKSHRRPFQTWIMAGASVLRKDKLTISYKLVFTTITTPSHLKDASLKSENVGSSFVGSLDGTELV